MLGASYETHQLYKVGINQLPDISGNVGDARRLVDETSALGVRAFTGMFVDVGSPGAWRELVADAEKILGRTESAVQDAAEAMVKVAVNYAETEDINMRLVQEPLGAIGRAGSL
jgi:hypothetical protein